MLGAHVAGLEAARAERAPPTRSEGGGGRPGICASGGRASSAGLGSDASSRAVYGCCGAAKISRTGASSTTCPPYITTTRSTSRATTPRSWVTQIVVMPSSRCSSATSPRICCWMVTSRAVVGSSAISRMGRSASAIAITTRWRMPPENSCGYARTVRAGSGMPTRSNSSSVRRRAATASTPCTRRTSATWSPTRISGCSEVIGSW
ncbi:hypothetical protein BJF90_24890 [Pseudonocardia sp. CNS-004]|nr:hypothetical protein BJF90_24890 [Pseudonocardia sp. CNS-004]